MEFLKTRGEMYTLPLGELYLSSFQEFVHDNILEYDLLDNLELKKQCAKKQELFDFICNSLTLFSGTDNIDDELKDICSNMVPVDQIVKYLIDKKQYDFAIKKMDSFILMMVKHASKMFERKKR